MATWTGTLNLNALTGDLTDNGRTITTVGSNVPVFGNGSTTTRINHSTGEYIDKTTQWQLYPNADGSPVLWIGTPQAPTYIYDTHYVANDWTNGGRFRSLSGIPLVVMQSVNYRGEAGGSEASFTGNAQNVAFHLENCNLAWTNANPVPFLGKNSLLRNVTITAPVGSGGAFFPSFLPESTNVTILSWGNGAEVEHGGPAWYRGFAFVSCTNDAWVWANDTNTSAGLSDGTGNFQDTVATTSKVVVEGYGHVKSWRTITGKTALANGTGVSGAYRYALYSASGVWVPYSETYAINASSQAGYYQTENTTFTGLSSQRNELAVYFRPGERLRIAGFSTSALNGDFTVTGRPWTVGLAQGNYADTRLIYVSGKNAATETTKSIVFTVLPPISAANGSYGEYKVQTLNARRNINSGNNTLAALLAGTNVYSGSYERNSWRVVEIPPYPYVRQRQDFTISTWAAAAGETVQWNTLAVNDALITQTNATTVAAYTMLDTAAKVYDYAEWLKRQEAYHAVPNLYDGIVTRTGTLINAGAYNVVVDSDPLNALSAPMSIASNTLTIKASTLSASLLTTGTVTLQNGATVTGSIEDVNGVRVKVRKSGGGNFNIAARSGTTGAYTYLGYQAGVSEVTYTVTKGTPVEVIMWSLGCVTYGRTISTVDGGVVLEAEMVVNASINTSLDVSAYLSNIALSLDTAGATPVFVITFTDAMTVSGIELGKALVHQLVGQEVALRSGFPPGSQSTIVIGSDEITINLPAVRLDVDAAVPVTGRVYLDFFLNQAPAQALTSSYNINPVRADGNQVQILRAKPTLDPSMLAKAVLDAGGAEEATVAAVKAKTDTIAAAPAATDVAAAVRSELATELARVDASVSSRLATAGYTAPDNTKIGQIKTKVDTLQNTDVSGLPTLAAIEGSTVLAKESTVADVKAKTDALTNGPSAADIKTAIEASGSKLDKAMKAAQAAEDNTL